MQYLKDSKKDEVDFLPIYKRQRFLQIATIILGVYGQACYTRFLFLKNNKFAISSQYLKKEVSDEVDFLLADKHQSLLQIDTIILTGMVMYFQISQNSKFAMFLFYLKK